MTDTQGNAVYAIAYDPYGKTYYTAGVDEAVHKYTDQEKDATGLYYYRARYYDPEIGRFISPDSVLAGLNRYAYCFNNPIKYNDPTGHTPKINSAADAQAYYSNPDGYDKPTTTDQSSGAIERNSSKK
ncbi:MAG: RHS repeat-associated core domain-containing protein [Spirochaetales bacterium]|nr:RHS repeat-associated core domain-containing protein [Spirochaetales bacterium]